MQVNNHNLRRQNQEIKLKQEQRANDIREIIKKIILKDESMNYIEYRENHYLEHLPEPLSSTQNIEIDYIFKHFKDCSRLYKSVLTAVTSNDVIVLQKFDSLLNLFKNSQLFDKVMSFRDKERDEFSSTHF
jgi:hypothetical protein